MLRSVHITNYYHEKSGGVSTSYNYLLAAANRHKRFVSLIVPGENERLDRIGEYGKIYYVAAKPSPFFDKRYRVMSPLHFGKSNTPIRNILFEEKPDMIEIYDNATLTSLAGMIRLGYMRQLNRPMLVYFTGERLDTIVNSFLASGTLGKWFSRRVMGSGHLPLFDFYIANSNYVADEMFESVLKKHNPRRIEAIHKTLRRLLKATEIPFEERVRICQRGVDTKFFNPIRRSPGRRRQILEKLQLPQNATILISSTRLSAEKNVLLLPEIMEVLAKNETHDFRLVIAGDGPLSDKIRQETERRFPGKIVLTGHLDKETLADHYANSDVFIHPNPREPFGNVGQEAMASGVPLLAPNMGGVLTYANDENAWLVEPNPDSFARAIVEIIGNSDLRNTRIKRALATAESNTNEKATDHLFSTYDELYADFTRRKELFANLLKD